MLTCTCPLPPTPPAAAGCGDKSMALKLVDLGTDVNCKDSVGGALGGYFFLPFFAGKKKILLWGPALWVCLCGRLVTTWQAARQAALWEAGAHLASRAAASCARPSCAHRPPPTRAPCPVCAGTAMHHAAMANKKEMMFALARLGCDWRARADGIDGATASFVLCGQHGKTTRQQVGQGGGAGRWMA